MNEQSPPKKLTRSRTDRYIGGVAAGIASRFEVDPIFVRIAFLASLAFGGLGLFAYVVLLAVMPVEGDPSQPMPPIETKRRNQMIGLAAIVGIIALATADSGGFATWIFGFWPGTVFGILFWVAASGVLLWLFASGAFSRDRDSTGPASPQAVAASTTRSSRGNEAPPATSTEVVSYAESPTQLSTEVMETRQMYPGAGSGRAAGSSDREKGPNAAEAQGPSPVRDDGPSTVGKIMVWFAIGLTALTLFCVLFVFSAGTTALFGGVPMAALVIVLGAGMIFAGLRGRRQLSLWLLAAAVAVTLPMAVVSIADLRVDGSYGDINKTPLSMVDVPDDGYKMAAGNMTIDLREFEFSRHRELRLPVSSGMGLTSIIVPDEVCVNGEVTGKVGVSNIRGNQSNGLDIHEEVAGPLNRNPGTRFAGPMLDLDADFKLGAFEVVDNTQWRQNGRGGSFEDGETGRDSANSAAARNRAREACSPQPGPAKGRQESKAGA